MGHFVPEMQHKIRSEKHMHAFCKRGSVLGLCFIVCSPLPSNKRKQSRPLLCDVIIHFWVFFFYIKPTAGRLESTICMLTLFAFKKNQKITKRLFGYLMGHVVFYGCYLFHGLPTSITDKYTITPVLIHIQVYFNLICCILSLQVQYVLIFSI